MINLKKRKEEIVKILGKDIFLYELKEKYPFTISDIPGDLTDLEKELYVVSFLAYHNFLSVNQSVISHSIKNNKVLYVK